MLATELPADSSSIVSKLPKRMGLLELGTNSFHLVIAEMSASGLRTTLHEKRRVQLGDDSFRTGQISPSAFERGLKAVRELGAVLRHARPDVSIAIATSAIRDAENGPLFASHARRLSGLDLRVIDGVEEARFAYLGAQHDLDFGHGRIALFDFGGGSTEVVLAESERIHYETSLPLGALRLRSQWAAGDPPNDAELNRLEDLVSTNLEPVAARLRQFQSDLVVFSCGTARKLLRLGAAELGMDPRERRLTHDGLLEIESLLATVTTGERCRLTGNDTHRVDTALPGAVALRMILRQTNATSAIVAQMGLREGLLLDAAARGVEEQHRATR